MYHHIIRRLQVATRKRETRACDNPPGHAVERICLLELFPPGQGAVQRRAIEVEIDGEQVWFEYEIVRGFESAAEATTYAAENGIEDVEL